MRVGRAVKGLCPPSKAIYRKIFGKVCLLGRIAIGRDSLNSTGMLKFKRTNGLQSSHRLSVSSTRNDSVFTPLLKGVNWAVVAGMGKEVEEGKRGPTILPSKCLYKSP